MSKRIREDAQTRTQKKTNADLLAHAIKNHDWETAFYLAANDEERANINTSMDRIACIRYFVFNNEKDNAMSLAITFEEREWILQTKSFFCQ